MSVSERLFNEYSFHHRQHNRTDEKICCRENTSFYLSYFCVMTPACMLTDVLMNFSFSFTVYLVLVDVSSYLTCHTFNSSCPTG